MKYLSPPCRVFRFWQKLAQPLVAVMKDSLRSCVGGAGDDPFLSHALPFLSCNDGSGTRFSPALATSESEMQDVHVLVPTNTAADETDVRAQMFVPLRIKLVAFVSCWLHCLTRRSPLTDPIHSSGDRLHHPFPFLPHHLQCPHHGRYLRCLTDMTQTSAARIDFVETHRDRVESGDYGAAVVGAGNIFCSFLAPFDVLRDFHTTVLWARWWATRCLWDSIVEKL